MAMALSIIAFLFLTAASRCTTMAEIAPDPRVFFADKINGNLTKITWAHAVNSRAKLDAALANDTIMMLEADISLGTVTGSNETVPIMAHPPANESDLSLNDFLNSALDKPTRGIKLDFKSIEAFNESLPILKNIRQKMTVPVFLNADILPGPVSPDDQPVDPDEFLTGAKNNFPESVLSIGWKTEYGFVNENSNSSYTLQQITEMIEKLNEHNITQTVTYPVRAALAARDITVMQELIKRSENHSVSLTVWSAIGDSVDGKNLSTLIKTIGVDKTYVDVPETVWRDLDLGSSSSIASPCAGLTLISFITYILGLFNSL